MNYRVNMKFNTTRLSDNLKSVTVYAPKETGNYSIHKAYCIFFKIEKSV